MRYSTRCEGLAAELRTASGREGLPVNAFDIAGCCGLGPEYSDVHHDEALLYNGTIYVSRRMRPQRAHLKIAHELGHWTLARHGQPDSESDADYIGAALLVPWDDLRRGLRAGWDLDEQRARHPNAPASTIAMRIAQVREASAAIYDGRRLRRRIGTGVLEREREVVDEVLETQRAVRLDDLSGAWPVTDGAYRRVIVLASNSVD